MKNAKPSGRAKTSGKKHGKKKNRRPLPLRILGTVGSVILVSFLSFFLLFCVTGAICAVVATNYMINYMENTPAVSIKELTMSYETNVYEKDAEGKDVVVYSVQNDVQRIPVTLDQIPQHVRDAFVYGEDKTFYSHEGVDYKRTFGSMLNMVLKFWNTDQGGSTITQQLVKNLTGDNDKSPQRKLREIHRATQLEKNYSKDEILETYMNYIGFGGAANGIEMAARKYFGKHVEQLTIAEAACLAAIPQNPEKNNPFAGDYQTAENPVTKTRYVTDNFINTGREVNRKRMEYILGQMYSNGAITFDEYQTALNEHLVFTDTEEYMLLHPELQEVQEDGSVALVNENETKSTTWVVDEALREFANYLMDDRGISFNRAMTLINTSGYQIYTTVDREMQDYIEKKYSKLDNLLAGMTNTKATTFFRDLNGDGVYADDENMTLKSGFTAIDYRGRILCTVGDIGEKQGSLGISYASTEKQQPGSAIKPVASYGYALENNLISWGTHVLDYPPLTKIDEKTGKEKLWPTNYADSNDVTKYSNKKICIFYALEKSFNTIPALLVKTYTPQKIYDFSTGTLGLDLYEGADIDYAPLAVGALHYGVTVKNLVNAYMPYGNGGYYDQAHIISRVETSDGKLVYNGDDGYSQIIDEETAYVMNKLLQNVVENGTGTAAKMTKNGKQVPIAGKTGTTTDWCDLMFVGLTPDFVSGVWVGYKEQKEIKNHKHIKSAYVWKNIIGEWIMNHYSGSKFPACETVVEGYVCPYTGKIANASCGKGEQGYWKSSCQPKCDNRELNLGFLLTDDE
ncbi:MAG: penicillin-binding protein [Oscillospiraceae bacterium]|nr:penicillin-binding protein [Oscillospiraceae bacterium]